MNQPNLNESLTSIRGDELPKPPVPNRREIINFSMFISFDVLLKWRKRIHTVNTTMFVPFLWPTTLRAYEGAEYFQSQSTYPFQYTVFCQTNKKIIFKLFFLCLLLDSASTLLFFNKDVIDYLQNYFLVFFLMFCQLISDTIQTPILNQEIAWFYCSSKVFPYKNPQLFSNFFLPKSFQTLNFVKEVSYPKSDLFFFLFLSFSWKSRQCLKSRIHD